MEVISVARISMDIGFSCRVERSRSTSALERERTSVEVVVGGRYLGPTMFGQMQYSPNVLGSLINYRPTFLFQSSAEI